jgi:hypothetical protein
LGLTKVYFETRLLREFNQGFFEQQNFILNCGQDEQSVIRGQDLDHQLTNELVE